MSFRFFTHPSAGAAAPGGAETTARPRRSRRAASRVERLRSLSRLALAVAATAVPLLVAASCSDDGVRQDDASSSSGGEPDAGSGGGGGEDGSPPVVDVLHPDAPPLPGESECVVEITTGITSAATTHLPVCTPVEYPTNPPSGGPHWGQWAAFKQYTTPVPREMYVHDMEHGAVVLAYRCDDACPDITDFFAEIYETRPADPLCVAGGQVSHRLLVTPDAELDVPVAAAAWGATYRATCLDRDSLVEFIDAHYGKAPEKICGQGKDIEAADGGIVCP